MIKNGTQLVTMALLKIAYEAFKFVVKIPVKSTRLERSRFGKWCLGTMEIVGAVGMDK
jgi:hypothetical protein